MKLNWNFLRGGGGGERQCKTKKTFHGGSMDILWNCTFQFFTMDSGIFYSFRLSSQV